jgi:hypothetical protein
MAMRPVAKSVYCRPKTHARLIKYCRRTRRSATEVVDAAINAALDAAAKKGVKRAARR